MNAREKKYRESSNKDQGREPCIGARSKPFVVRSRHQETTFSKLLYSLLSPHLQIAREVYRETDRASASIRRTIFTNRLTLCDTVCTLSGQVIGSRFDR